MAAMSIEFRVNQPATWRAAADAFRGAILAEPSTDDDWTNPWLADSWADGHSISAWDGARCVGNVAAFHFDTFVPGGALLPTAGLSRVGVLQTHTRRGVLTGAMSQLLHDSVAQGKVLASLRASEAVIYGRFGFAVAGEAWSIEIDHRRGARVVAPTAAGTLRILDRDETLATVMEIHARIGFDRPGAVSRAAWMHRRFLADALVLGKAAYVVVHTGLDGVDDGWALYSTDWQEVFGEEVGGQCVVHDLRGANPSVELALWKFILELDLVDRVRAEWRPFDDAVRFALGDQRHYKSKLRLDEQWLRLLDVDAALRARAYNAASGAVTVAVTDPLFEANTGTWRIAADGVERVSTTALDDAQLATTIGGISAVYMGGTAWNDMWASGQVQQRHNGAVATADVLFASRPQPRCGTFF